MAGMYGADVEQLRALAKVFSDASDRLERDRMTVGNQIKINAWVGPVATQFRMQWDSEHSVCVASAAHLLAESATKLRKNAQEQEDASRSDGPSSGSSRAAFPIGGISDLRTMWATAGRIPEDILRSFFASNANRSVQDLIDAIREGEVPGRIKPWDLLASIGAVRDIPGLSVLSNFMDVAHDVDKIQNGTFDGYDAADWISKGLKANGDPVSRLLGANVKVWSEVWREGSKADFSQATIDNNANFAATNPGAVIEEIGKATFQVGSKLVGWLL
ncbi:MULTISPECIES: hypothetical protein [unclassified Cryobacterium]|uniref:hypothetical protein n=1 Tax=unclassified Cryobacterium TaxID=2649013 RepID=UPI002AB3ED58|nr:MULTISPECIES: hypothetical protein [unclassified Cryobacterium]MDY7540847.1 hypothetical protein [Cryobacterium sp. 5B3]MEB0002474.1 hypothetical protein [Cryobacterium sp. RTC2.1]MEB0267440.1 hypothetical protein [Cryobacterium sp. 10I5]MEB0276560.1 hypothetical protein [Cryobacterium sp. 5B3]